MPFDYIITSQRNLDCGTSLGGESGAVVLSFCFDTPIMNSATTSSCAGELGGKVVSESVTVSTITVESGSGSQSSTASYIDSGIENDLLRSGVISRSNYLSGRFVYLADLPFKIQKNGNTTSAKNYIAKALRKMGNYVRVI